MRLIRGFDNLPSSLRGGAVTIGNFDGVHRGHQRMLAELRARADELGGPALLLSFEPHPLEYLHPEKAPPRITRLRDKLLALRGCGLDALICLRFGPRLAALEAEAFVRRVLHDGLEARYLLVGDDFRFGRGRGGDYALLKGLAPRYGLALGRMDTVAEAGGRISSTRIRERLAAGELAEAERLLGRPYAISGRVSHGQRLGRELGFPTLNLPFIGMRPPLRGIFTVRVHGLGAPREGVASIGTRPTVNGRGTVLEVYLLDFDQQVYGRHVRVEFLHWLRDEQRFDSLEALRAQIAADVAAARHYFTA
ncbi:bifunctional riboflavin kinase/FAD synthetase [Alkalilimnicola sp. S0819]|uniref:bifunctional riboflavin kinase/FAD synthetase n=1 Tax=Alkalilimnicola sp. S0819 TaxID=2613922 RepID=UPI0012624668|nr:bifunctional riboflavin kinase/FAD synthetase [Alkalilimnicola sp. S0819]KAB7623145.1 bifunctional riboflavin kinase/FAD synthetase [Alkalilimnicola sp. S0819]MPQ16989.1 bifunctional riboflavin kinase/FAD synthetase [Alkalilimnicola sp. S0819]